MQQEGGATGIRDLALLESAVMMPQQQFGGAWLHPDVAAMAAPYLSRFQHFGKQTICLANTRVALGCAYRIGFNAGSKVRRCRETPSGPLHCLIGFSALHGPILTASC
jgi:hypothetical protein